MKRAAAHSPLYLRMMAWAWTGRLSNFLQFMMKGKWSRAGAQEVVVGGDAADAELEQRRERDGGAVDPSAADRFSDAIDRHHDRLAAELPERETFGCIIDAHLLAFETIERSDRHARMEAFRFGRIGSDHEELLISLEPVRFDEAAVDKRRLAQIPEQTGELDDRIVVKALWRQAGDDEGDIGDAIDDELRLLQR